MTKVKICGLKTPDEVEIVNKFCPDYVGFVFAPTKRFVPFEKAKELKAMLKPTIKAVGVFVNEPVQKIIQYEKAGIIDMIQLHGDEDLVYMNSLKKESKLTVIKAVRIKDESSFKENQNILESSLIDYILLDTYHSRQYGGTGKCFNWHLLKTIRRPFFLAGGIGVDNVEEAISYQPYAIDISSKVEVEGIKNEGLLKAIFCKLDQIEGRGGENE